jgi:sugar lactone lactonase YvrE
LRVVRTIPTGKWPEAVSVVGRSAYIADSGDRRLLVIDLDTQATKSFRAGRLPTELAPVADGALLALVETDKRIVRLDAGARKVRTLTRLPDCPDSMTVDGPTAYALLWKACSSAGSQVVRVDLKSGKQRASAPLDANASAIAAAGGRVYVAHSGGVVAVLDAETLETRARWALPDVGSNLIATETAVFVTSGQDLARVEATTGAVTARATLPAAAHVLALRDDRIYAALETGRVLVLAAANLMPVTALVPAGEPFRPTGLAFDGDRLLMTTFKIDGVDAATSQGRLLVLEAGSAPAP